MNSGGWLSHVPKYLIARSLQLITRTLHSLTGDSPCGILVVQQGIWFYSQAGGDNLLFLPLTAISQHQKLKELGTLTKRGVVPRKSFLQWMVSN